jgi:hypothetical protein
MAFLTFACGLYAALYGAWWIVTTSPRNAGIPLLAIGIAIILFAYRLAFP